jgi:hypothetical protein
MRETQTANRSAEHATRDTRRANRHVLVPCSVAANLEGFGQEAPYVSRFNSPHPTNY